MAVYDSQIVILLNAMEQSMGGNVKPTQRDYRFSVNLS